MVSRKHKKHMRKIRRMRRESEEEFNINDLCPHTYVCREPWCYDKFGKYYSCRRYIENNPRVDSNTVYIRGDPWRD